MEPKILGFSYKDLPGGMKIGYAFFIFGILGLIISISN